MLLVFGAIDVDGFFFLIVAIFFGEVENANLLTRGIIQTDILTNFNRVRDRFRNR